MKKHIFIIALVLSIFTLSACVEIDLNTSDLFKKENNFTYEVTKAYKTKSNISYYIEGTVTNNSDKDYSYVQIEFICYDKEGNNLGTAIDNTNNLLGNQKWKFKAMALFTDIKNIDHCDYHEITGW